MELPFAYVLVFNNTNNTGKLEVIRIQELGPPEIVAHPRDAEVCPGETTRLSTTGARRGCGDLPMAQKWDRPFGGADERTLTLNGQDPDVAGSYDGVVANVHGSVTTDPALVTLLPEISILAQPEAKIGTLGGQIQFQVETSGPATYQWRKDGQVIQGATSPELMLSDFGF